MSPYLSIISWQQYKCTQGSMISHNTLHKLLKVKLLPQYIIEKFYLYTHAYTWNQTQKIYELEGTFSNEWVQTKNFNYLQSATSNSQGTNLIESLIIKTNGSIYCTLTSKERSTLILVKKMKERPCVCHQRRTHFKREKILLLEI